MAATDATDKNSSPKSNGAEADSARIGWAFLSQYYSYLNKDPARLHCFYTKRSTLIHSTEGEDSTPCYGQQEIHAKIMSLQLDDCKVYISNVDSQGSAEHGIIVQVIGEMSNANGPWRKFAQTFFLAEQPNGYFVLNDICRYIKEEGDGDEPAHLTGADAPAVQSDDQPTNAAHANDNAADGEPASVQSVLFNEASTPPPAAAAAAAAQPDQASSSTEQEQPTPQSGSTDSFTFHANGIAADAADESPAAAAAAAASKEEPTPAEAEPEVPAPPSSVEEPSKPESAQQEEATTAAAVEEPQPITAVEEKEASAPEPAAAPAPAPAKAPEPKKDEVKKDEPAPAPAPVSAPTPKSWASLAASNTTKKWAGVATSERKGTSAAPTTPAADSRPAASSSSSSAPSAPSATAASTGAGAPEQSASGSAPASSPFVDAVLAVKQPQCFVKGVLETVSDRLLRDTLTTRFGPLKEVDIVRSKACAFIEFEKLESARRAIQTSLRPTDGGEGGIMLPLDDGSHQRINVVERKPHGDRPISSRGGRGGSAAGGPGGAGGGEGRGGYKGGEGGRGGRGASSGTRGMRGGRGRGGAAASAK
ncbi:hypothetical protein JCM3775_005421 [Rhodotorula graminis]